MSVPLPFSTRADGELEDFARSLRRAALAVSSAQGETVFTDLVGSLAETLDVEIAFVALFVEDDPSSVVMRAAVMDGRPADGMRYRLDRTPCATVIGREFRAYPARLRELFPLEDAFVKMEVEGYAGFPINDSHGRPLGLIAAISRKPLQYLARFESILQIYAVRVAAELERQNTEQALRNREEQYRAIFDGSSDALTVWSRNIELVDANRAFTTMFGFARDEVIGRGYGTYLPSDEVAARVEKIRRALAGEEGALETRSTRKNGERFDVELRYLPIVYRDQPHVLVIARDITARKQAEQALRNREEQYRAIFEGSSDALGVWSRDIKLVDVNEAFTRMYGYSRDDVIGGGFGQRLTSEDVARRVEKIQRALAGEEGVLETDSVRKNGERFEVELRYLPIVYRDEPHVLVIARDITARKEAEQALRLREEQYRVIFESTSDGFVLRNSHGRTIDANPAFYRMYGFARDHIAGGGGYPVHFPREYVEKREAQVRRALEGHETHLEETLALRADGSPFWIDLRVIPISYRGEPHVLQVVRDVTERHRAEERRLELESQLRQAQKMEAIGQLTGGIAHDFNNILTSVIGYVVLATERAQASGDAKLVRQLEQAHIAAQRARDLIGQMLAFARRQHGERRVIALAPVVRQAVQLLRATLPSTIELDHETAADTPPAQADPVQLEQVLFNLCINARDAIHGAGRIRVRLRATTAGGWRCASCRQAVGPARWVEIGVSDDGSGIEPDVLERMFEPFYSTKEVGRGSGMGLAMVHGIVHEHGGHLNVVSTPGAGSTFSMMLPPASGAPNEIAADALPAAERPAAALRGRVMVVEDQAMVGDFLRELLEGWGLDVVLERDADAAALKLADAEQPLDVLITDQTMPRMTGLELARHAAALRPTLPIVLCTGDAAPFESAQLERCGVRALLRKPIDPERLRTLLRGLLTGV